MTNEHWAKWVLFKIKGNIDTRSRRGRNSRVIYTIPREVGVNKSRVIRRHVKQFESVKRFKKDLKLNYI